MLLSNFLSLTPLLETTIFCLFLLKSTTHFSEKKYLIAIIYSVYSNADNRDGNMSAVSRLTIQMQNLFIDN